MLVLTDVGVRLSATRVGNMCPHLVADTGYHPLLSLFAARAASIAVRVHIPRRQTGLPGNIYQF